MRLCQKAKQMPIDVSWPTACTTPGASVIRQKDSSCPSKGQEPMFIRYVDANTANSKRREFSPTEVTLLNGLLGETEKEFGSARTDWYAYCSLPTILRCLEDRRQEHV
ncbi:hypothetical protein T265_04034 [Opisthorchis viverrini]|uniref:Uncharacterized protein n=1 Tax=Opisthorchis viverrini TaxID=6198 RepID=A0A074ZQB6_OPIVI|nr:hypothetical protein T265_04034 [Opisthorchis viverrini]KER29281.1 hypothetical protein T265_04034 [Opisthorchis viverrini]